MARSDFYIIVFPYTKKLQFKTLTVWANSPLIVDKLKNLDMLNLGLIRFSKG